MNFNTRNIISYLLLKQQKSSAIIMLFSNIQTNFNEKIFIVLNVIKKEIVENIDLSKE